LHLRDSELLERNVALRAQLAFRAGLAEVDERALDARAPTVASRSPRDSSPDAEKP
jgi:hypothetical protein